MAPLMQTLIKCTDGSRPRILFAEDSDTVRQVTAALLRRMGCDVDAVAGPGAAYRSRRAPGGVIEMNDGPRLPHVSPFLQLVDL